LINMHRCRETENYWRFGEAMRGVPCAIIGLRRH